jgi:hypothetical protein
VLSLGGGLLNAYNLSISYAAASVLAADSYEVNDTPAQSRYLYSVKGNAGGLLGAVALNPSVSIEANLHTAGDVDYYRVRGINPTVAQKVLLGGGPIIEVYGNEAAMKLEVYNLNPDNTQGSLVQSVSSPACTAGNLRVGVESDKYYLVRVSGDVGRYTLFNGARADPRKLPEWVKTRYYEVLHPGDPIEFKVRNPITYLITGDRSYSQVKVKGKFKLTLSDFEGIKIAEGIPGNGGFDQVLSLAAVQAGAIYGMEVSPEEISEEGSAMSLEWEENAAVRSSGNIISNASAEEGPGNDTGGAVDSIQDWFLPNDSVRLPTVIYYNGVNSFPDQNSPGPENRGQRFFAGGPSKALSAIRQNVQIATDWHSTIDKGTVKFKLAAFLGGYAGQSDNVSLTVTFLGPNFQELGQTKLGPIAPEEREGKTGLFPVATSDYLPVSTRFMYVDLEFRRNQGDYNDGYADDLELSLHEFSP